jgi:hypothetical protein
MPINAIADVHLPVNALDINNYVDHVTAYFI